MHLFRVAVLALSRLLFVDLFSQKWRRGSQNTSLENNAALQLERVQRRFGRFPGASEQRRSLRCSCVASDASFPTDWLELFRQVLQFSVSF